MGWENRKRGGRYYTRSRKVKGRVVREYLGTGEVARAAATLDTIDRLDRIEKAAAFRKECERLDELDRAVGELCDFGDLAARGALMAAGYHRHNRGEWRRRRDPRQKAED